MMPFPSSQGLRATPHTAAGTQAPAVPKCSHRGMTGQLGNVPGGTMGHWEDASSSSTWDTRWAEQNPPCVPLRPPASPHIPPPLQPLARCCSASPAVQPWASVCGCVCPGVLQGAARCLCASMCVSARVCMRVCTCACLRACACACACVCVYREGLFAYESGRVLRRAVSFIV